MSWNLKYTTKRPELDSPILIEGLPGIGNVGKVAVDFIIDEIGAKKLVEFESQHLPHSVFINEKNLVDLPTIEVYYKQFKNKQDMLLLAGDVQPVDEQSCYSFSEKVLDILQDFKGRELVTVGGIALKQEPKEPQVFCTGNSRKMVSSFKDFNVQNKLYGLVGPIMGVSGLLMGLAKRRNIKAASLLAETYGHPMYLGVRGARQILSVLNGRFNLKLNLRNLDNEIEELENEMNTHSKEIKEAQRKHAISKMRGKFGEEINYIG